MRMTSTQPTTQTPAKKWTAGTLEYTSAGLVVLFAWLLLGDFSWSMRERSVFPMAQWYLKHINVPNLLFALVIGSFPALLGLVLGPIISVKSDRHRGPWGRRIPFLLITTPIAVFGMLGLALCPVLGPHLHRLLGAFSPGETGATLICFSLFWAAFEFATIVANALFGALINDVVPEGLLGRFYGLFRAISLIGGMIFNYWLMGKVEAHYSLIMVVIAIFYGVSFLWVCLKVKEGEYSEPAPRDTSCGWLAATKSYFSECFGRAYYVWIFIMFTASGLAFMPVNTFTIPYASSLGMSMDAYGHCMTLTFMISLALAYFLGWLADKFHPLRVSIASLLGYLAVMAWASFCARTVETFSIALVLHGVLSGCYFTSSASLGQRLFPHSRFAQFASAAGILGSVAGILLGPGVGALIDVTGDLYYNVFIVGGILALIGLGASWWVYREFKTFGGPVNYAAPE